MKVFSLTLVVILFSTHAMAAKKATPTAAPTAAPEKVAAPATATAEKSAGKTSMKFGDGEGKIEFHATTHPVGVNVNGTGPSPKGTLTSDHGKLSGELVVDMTKLEAGMAMRTNHMKEKALEVEKFPEAKLLITDLKLINGADSIPFRGDLTLHGVTKPVEGKAKIERKEDSLDVKANFDVKLSDFAIAIKPFAGVSVDDKVAITVEATAKQ